MQKKKINKPTTYQNTCDVAKALVRENFIAADTYIKNEDLKSIISLYTLRNQKQNNLNQSYQKEENNQDSSGNKHNRGQENKAKSIKSKMVLWKDQQISQTCSQTRGKKTEINKIREVVKLLPTPQQ